MFRESGLILVDLYVNGTKAFDSSNILSGTFSVNRFSSSAIAPEFGNVSSGELTFTIDTTTVTPTLQRGDIITGNLYLAEDTTETKAIGEFIVTNLVQGFNVLEVTCLDRMIELDIEADLSGVTYPITAEDFLTDVFHDTLGYTLNISNNVYKLVSLKQPVFEVGTTYRQVLSKVCECMGANAWYSDRLNISWYSDSGETIDDSVYVNADLSDNGFGISVEVTQDPSQKAVEIGTDITLRIVNNPFLANATAQERTAIATAIETNIGNVTFYGAVMTVLPMPELNPMDIVEVDGKDVPITSITYGLNENTKLEGKIDSDNNTYNYTPQRDIAIMKTEVEEVKENNKHFFYLDDSGAHITETENDFTTGNNILIDSDSVDIRDGTTTLASFGSTTRIGEGTKTHIDIDFRSLQLKDAETNTFFYIGDLRNEQGYCEASETFTGNGSRAVFDLLLPAQDTSYTVTLNGVDASSLLRVKRVDRFEFIKSPSNGDIITVEYKTDSPKAKVYTAGLRKASEPVGIMSFAEGLEIVASGFATHAEGNKTTSSGDYSHSEGGGTTASGPYSHAEGCDTTASGSYSHAEGCDTTASGIYSHAEGDNTTASGAYSHAEGDFAQAVGFFSHAEGSGGYARGDASHSEGSQTEAAGNSSHAEGVLSYADGDYSHAQNEGTIASGDSQTALGKYNIKDTNNDYAVIVGNGTDDNNRSNALTIDWSGNAVLAGGVTDGSGNVLSNVASKVTALQTWTTQTYTFQGLSITVKYNNAIPTLLRVKVYGTLNAVMNSASAYVTIASTGLTIPVPTLGYVQLNAIAGGQLRVTSSGDIQIGYTRNYGATANSNLASGAGVYIDQAIIVG